jgi:hypothetical protein
MMREESVVEAMSEAVLREMLSPWGEEAPTVYRVSQTGRHTARGQPAFAVGGKVKRTGTLRSGSLRNALFPTGRGNPTAGVWLKGDFPQALGWLRKLGLTLAADTPRPMSHVGGQPHVHAIDPVTGQRSAHIFVGQRPPSGDFFD